MTDELRDPVIEDGAMTIPLAPNRRVGGFGSCHPFTSGRTAATSTPSRALLGRSSSMRAPGNGSRVRGAPRQASCSSLYTFLS